jgi:hypothetical protein
MDPEKDYENYYMCIKDADFCGVGCTQSEWEAYICKSSSDGSSTKEPSSGCELPAGCKAEMLWETGKLSYFLKSYDENNDDCKKFVDEKYYPVKSKIMQCKVEDIDCEKFVISKKAECALKYLNNGDIYWITYYDAACDTEVNNLFSIAQFCTEKPTTTQNT